MSDKIDVNVLKQPVGVLSNENEKFIFTYTHIRDFVSLTMPPRTQQYVNNKLHPIFEMNLPEGYLLSIIKKHFSKIVKTDEFGLLKLIS
ncbi:HipA N-terminal domain-containing protein, partial [Sulfurimonas sp.]|uniref:HipA N-terminal domain-containing protein n=1 Tax=Sulfurimonas sp. TaxID=2022749 RepID=UPI00262DB38A